LLTNAAQFTPLALTASITESTFFSRERAFAFRVGDNFQGVFLDFALVNSVQSMNMARTREDHQG